MNGIFEQLQTPWALLQAAHDPKHPAHRAQLPGELLFYYLNVVQQYFCEAVHNEELAAELTQEFAVRFLRGDFRGANPNSGRFRDYLRCSLQNMIRRAKRRSKHFIISLEKAPQLAVDTSSWTIPEEEVFLRNLRNNLVQSAEHALTLEEASGRTSQPYTVVLSFWKKLGRTSIETLTAAVNDYLTTHPPSNSKLAKSLPLSPNRVCKILQRGRDRLALLVWNELQRRLPHANCNTLQQELIDLKLTAVLDRIRRLSSANAATGSC